MSIEQKKQLLASIQQYINETTAYNSVEEIRIQQKTIFLDEVKNISKILEKIIELRSRNQVKEFKQKQFRMVWKAQNNYLSIFNANIRQNFKCQTSEEKLKQQYLQYVTNRHYSILKMLQQSKNSRFPQYQNLIKNEQKHQIQIIMQLGLIIPITCNQLFSQFKEVIISRLPRKIRQKFIIELAECLSSLNQLKIQHNDIKIGNIIYSLIDNRFKFIDYDFARIRTFKNKENNYTFCEIFNQNQVQKYHQSKIFNQQNNILIGPCLQEDVSQLYFKSNEQNCLKFKKEEIQELSSTSQRFYKIMQDNCGKIDSIMFGNLLIQIFDLKEYDKSNQSSFSFNDIEDIHNAINYSNVLDFLQNNSFQQQVLFNKKTNFVFNLVEPSMLLRLNCTQFLKKLHSIKKRIALTLQDNQRIYQNQTTILQQILDKNNSISSNISNKELQNISLDQTMLNLTHQSKKQEHLSEEQELLFEEQVHHSINLILQNQQENENPENLEKTVQIERIKKLENLLQFQQKFYQQQNNQDINDTKILLAKALIGYGKVERGQKLIKVCSQYFSRQNKEIWFKITQTQAFKYLMQNKFQNALMKYLETVEILKQIKFKSIQYANALVSIAKIQYMEVQPKKAISYFQQAQNIFLNQVNNNKQINKSTLNDFINCQKSMGLYFQRIDQYELSTKRYILALQISKKKQQLNIKFVIQCIIISQIFNKNGKYFQSLQWFNKGMTLSKILNNISQNQKAELYMQIGKYYLLNDQYQQALQNFWASQKILKQIRNGHLEYLFNLHSIAMTYSKMKSLQLSQQIFFKCFSIFFKMLLYKYSSFISKQSQIYIYDNQSKEQKKYSTFGIIQSLFNIQQIKDLRNPFNSIGLTTLGQVYIAKKQYLLALQYFELALKMRQVRNQLNCLYSSSIFNLIGNVYIGLQNSQKSLFYLQKALFIRKEIVGQDHLINAATFDSFGQYYLSIFKYDQAKQSFGKAVMIRKQTMRQQHPSLLNSIQRYQYCKQYKEKVQ